MKLTKYISAIAIAASLVGVTQAKDNAGCPVTNSYFAPVYNVPVNVGGKIYVDYTIPSPNHVLSCHATQGVTSINWAYKDVWFKGLLPVVLKTNPSFNGQLADSHGLLTIANEFAGSETKNVVYVTCEYNYVWQ